MVGEMKLPSQSLSPKITYCLNFLKDNPEERITKGLLNSASKKREATLAKVMLITMT